MVESVCRACGSELLPATAFCRRCGAAAGDNGNASEQPTALFAQAGDGISTQRLDPRPTSPDRGGLRAPVRPTADRSSRRMRLLVAGTVAATVAALVAFATIIRTYNSGTTNQPAITKEALMYPGAQTIVDLKNSDGTRTIQLQTSDSLDLVARWYEASLSMTKTIRLTGASTVMHKGKVTIALATEDNRTVILIKQLP